MDVPVSLRRWFVAHALVNVALAVPLLVAPEAFLGRLGWSAIDGVTARLLGAALLALGTQAWAARGAGVEVYKVLLGVKIVWALAAVTGLLMSLGEGAPTTAWVFLSAQLAFAGVWIHHRVRFRQWDGGPLEDHDPEEATDATDPDPEQPS